jgi:SsrA-binding protein
MAKTKQEIKIIAQNKRAYHDYFIDEVYEAGIVLRGTEVKSLRNGRITLTEAHAGTDKNEIFIYNIHIPEYTEANRFNHHPKRPRKLLLKRREIKKLIGLITRRGLTLVPLKIYFNERNKVKIALAVARGKKLHDKRETIKQREWDRRKNRMMSEGEK